MKIKELRELSKDELVARRGELKKQGIDSRVQHVGGQLENTAIFRQLRKEVAFIETILSERRLNIQYRGRSLTGVAAVEKAKRDAAPKQEKAAAKPAKKAAAKKATAKKAAKAQD